MARPFSNPDVNDIFDSYPSLTKVKLLEIRELIFSVADKDPEIGEIEETLKWDVPSYLTKKPKSGTTIRLSPFLDGENGFSFFTHCQSSMISDFKQLYPKLHYEGNRAIHFSFNESLDTIKHFIYLALTYHIRKKK
jgi:hypothetical protein